MKCCKCGANIGDDALFCPECGARQEESTESTAYCPNCGYRLEEDAMFCPECGNKVGGTEPEIKTPEEYIHPEMPVNKAPAPVRKGKGGRLVAVFLGLAIVILGVGGFFIYRAVNRTPKEADTYAAEDSGEKTAQKAEEKQGKDDVKKADIVALGGESCSLEGTVKKDSGGRSLLAWDDGVSISGLDENGETVLAKEVSNVYINDIGLEDGVLEAIPSNKKVVLDGQIYFIGDSIYIKANKITDETGAVIENNKNQNSQVIQDTISYDYIIPYSSTVLLEQWDIDGLTLQEINYAKNEIYARHGRRFKSPELQNYFNSKSWYSGTIEADAFSDSVMSEIEKKNVTFLSDVEFSINSSGYQLDVR